MMAVEFANQTIDHLCQAGALNGATVTADIERRVFYFKTDNLAEEIPFSLSDFDLALVTAGGWLEYAELKY